MAVPGRGWRRGPRLPAMATPGAPLIEARDVTVRYGGHAVLRDVDLVVRAGEVLALVGPNGAGKSTLLGVLAGDVSPQIGSVVVDGAPLRSWSPDELAVRRAVLLQQVDVSFPFTVTQVVRMGRSPWAGTPAEDWDDDVIADALVEADVALLAARTYTTLSGGERSRAALARVLAQEPSALLLDEPTASLDVRHQELVLGLARQRAARGDAVVVVLHDLDLAASYADAVAVLAGGRVVARGAPGEVLTAELLTDVYEHPIEVFRHPRTGALVITPRRDRRVDHHLDHHLDHRLDLTADPVEGPGAGSTARSGPGPVPGATGPHAVADRRAAVDLPAVDLPAVKEPTP